MAPSKRDFCLFLTLFPHHILRHLSLIQHDEVNIHSTFSRSLDIRLRRGYASSGCITNTMSMDTESAREGSRDQRLFRLWDMYIKDSNAQCISAFLPNGQQVIRSTREYILSRQSSLLQPDLVSPLNVKLRMRQMSAILNSQLFSL